MSMFSTPNGPQSGDHIPKAELVGSRVVIKLLEYDPARPTEYGESACAFGDLVVIDGTHAGKRDERYLFAGNIGKQVGAGLDVDGLAPARVIKGSTKRGGHYFGVEWITDPVEVAEIEPLYLAIINDGEPPAASTTGLI
jgi:hypothetical protein